MKKFLDLKRSIVDSKNQPTLMQTYLDTIRSSCYKLATPYVSPRLSCEEAQKQNMVYKDILNTNKNEVKNKEQIFKKVSQETVSPIKRGSNNKNKKVTYRCNISQLMESTNQSESNETIIKNIQNISQSAQHTPKAISSNQIQQIFQTLQSNCKTQSKQSEQYQSEKQIIQTIMMNLNMLNKKKEYQQSIMLIKNIIEGMGQIHNDTLAHHSQIKNIDYIMQTPEPQIGSSRENSHFKSCMQVQEKEYDNKLQNSKKNVAIRMDWTKSSVDSNKSMDKKIKIVQKQMIDQLKQRSQVCEMPLVIKYTVHKNPYKSYEGESIYIQDSQNQQIFNDQQYEHNQQTDCEQLDNTMKSQDLNKWKQDQLYEISQHQEDQQDPKSSLNSSVVPEETIEFKKILYMLDSGSTNKKIPQLFLSKDPQRISKDTHKNSHNQSRNSQNSKRSVKKLFTTLQQQIQNRNTKQIEQQDSNYDENSEWINANTSKSSLKSPQNSKNNTHTKSESSLKFKTGRAIKQAAVNQVNKGDKSKDLMNIVDLLNKKYNRTVKLTK